MTSQNHADNSESNKTPENDGSQNDRLSAWLDGELSLEDRSQLERELNESPALQLELAELRKLSDLVRGLPKQSAPDELKPSVMRAVERDSLLTPRSSSAGLDRAAILKFGTVAVLVCVAVVIWINREPEIEQVTDFVPVTDSQAPPEMKANKQQERDAVVDQANDVGTVTAKGFLLEKDQLNAASIGDFVKALVRDGDSVSVVRLRVVDRQESIEALELVLSKEKGVKNIEENNGLVAVYIESGPEKLSEAIAQMGDGLDRMEFTSQIQLSDLDPDFVKAMEAHQLGSGATVISQIPFEAGSKLDQLSKGADASFLGARQDPSAGNRVRVIFLLGDKSEAAKKPSSDSGAT
jgi:hypothetical protein